MESILTVTAPAPNRLLVSLDTVKSELQITDSSSDDLLEKLRARASQSLTGYCYRQFARDEVSEQFRDVCSDVLLLSAGFPDPQRVAGYASIASITADGVVLDPADYELDPATGLLYRLSSDCRICWRARKVAVAYTAGYTLPDDGDPTLPDEVQGAAVELIKAAKFAASRDPQLRSENVLAGLYSYTLFDPRNAESSWPATVTDPMSKYRNDSF